VAQQPEAGPAQDASLSKETRAAPAIHPALPEFRIAACGRLGRVDELFESTRAKLRHCVALGQATGRAPSLTGAVARDGQVLWCAGRGSIDGAEPTADTQYRIGSLTKTFTAVLIMQLRDGGRLDLADRASPISARPAARRDNPRAVALAHGSSRERDAATVVGARVRRRPPEPRRRIG
jgi:CubicO group peptidase (beta-lactamase class C family)